MIELKTNKMLARVEAGLGWVTFNNPERHNAVSLEMWAGLGRILEAFQQDDAVRVVVLSGAGNKAFVSGADISEFDTKRSTAEQKKIYGEVAAHANHWLNKLDKPLIAMIQGYCIGGGLATALSADVRFATPESTFGIPAARLGLGYDYGGLKRLCDLVGPSRAKDIMLSARFMSAAEAESMGLINRICAADELEDEVRAYASIVADNAPLTIRAAKAAIDEAVKDPADRDLSRIESLINACFDSEDYREGRRAFKEKRRPNFLGH